MANEVQQKLLPDRPPRLDREATIPTEVMEGLQELGFFVETPNHHGKNAWDLERWICSMISSGSSCSKMSRRPCDE